MFSVCMYAVKTRTANERKKEYKNTGVSYPFEQFEKMLKEQNRFYFESEMEEVGFFVNADVEYVKGIVAKNTADIADGCYKYAAIYNVEENCMYPNRELVSIFVHQQNDTFLEVNPKFNSETTYISDSYFEKYR